MRSFAALAVAAAALWSAPAAAQGARVVAPDWAFGAPGGEVAVAAVSAASLATVLLPQRRSGWSAATSTLWDPQIGLVSDFTGATVGTLLAAGAAFSIEGSYLADAGVPGPFARSFRTSIIDIESAALATGIAITIKRMTGRCRPRTFHLGRCEPLVGEYDAFPSGHTTPVAAIAGARLLLLLRTPGDSGDASLRLGALAVAEGMALVTMGLRIGAGAHSWEDVGTGWLLGHATGLLVAALHPMVDVPTAPGAPPRPAAEAASFAWSAAF